ncbi:hypothetical protein M406DRAFT_253240 [Cryphonectria parasitica EP155]|uniref:Uncharacterized protein n=1 Tax=Cryphonectria parasitica (strain ATCC 38755 / EP155) TaxID=660469 RepID=A0A9P4Y530_CRYP1|nr:uncharacterized protein M406DRAFT_253240 [Cryphonectria parasitica EP155]KAF3767077.1 hypothetical protein M406DRAFT_253240 [Cryphonectria parasitica EP155]
MLFDTHKPIIDRFGRYPYRNGTLARASTPEEVEWLEQVGHYGETPSEVARQVKRDVERGIWQPLGEGKIEDE